jgi:ornithine cyclodeaminase/alanine dehydrogenase-like protein (mu-crystallin family)
MMVKKPAPSPSSLTILSSSDVDSVLSSLDPELALASQSSVFTSFSRPPPPVCLAKSEVPDIQIPHRLTVLSPEMTMLFMPSRAGEAGGTGCKIVSVPSAGGEGLPASTLVMDEKTGKVKAVINARKLTALRNACGGYQTSQHPARADSEQVRHYPCGLFLPHDLRRASSSLALAPRLPHMPF